MPATFVATQRNFHLLLPSYHVLKNFPIDYIPMKVRQEQAERADFVMIDREDCTNPKKGWEGENMSEEKNPMTDQGNTYNDSGNPRYGYDGGSSSQNSEPGPRAQSEGNSEAPLGSASNPLPEQRNVYAEASNGLGYDEDQVPDSQADSDQAQTQGQDHPAGQVPGQTASQVQGQENFAQTSGMEGYYGGTTQQEQEGQKVNVEQAHQTNTAQYKGKPGTKAPSPGQEQGTAWSQDMELSNSDVPARNPDSY